MTARRVRNQSLATLPQSQSPRLTFSPCKIKSEASGTESSRTLSWRGESTANSSLKLGADSGRVMDDSRTVKRLFPARISPEIVLFALAAGSALRQLSPCDYVRFWRWAPSASMNLPSIKRAGSPHYTVIRLKTSFCSATYRPKAHRPIYRDLGAFVHSKYLHHSVRYNALIVGAWSRSSSSGSMGGRQRGAPDASGGTV